MSERRTNGNKRVTAMAALAAAIALQGGAHAAPARTTWSTFLRSGPGETYQAIDEVQHDTLVDVGACNGRWCAVRVTGGAGYIDKDALSLPKPASGAAPAGGALGCFVANQTGYKQSTPTRFCGTVPASRP